MEICYATMLTLWLRFDDPRWFVQIAFVDSLNRKLKHFFKIYFELKCNLEPENDQVLNWYDRH